MDYSEFIATFAYDKFVDLSAASAALCLSAIGLLNNRKNWSDDGDDLTDTQWDEIESIIALANREIMTSLVGAILPHAMSTVSAFKMLDCDGSTYNKSDYPLLYAAIDPVFIISGSQFAVPDMRDRVPVGSGSSYTLDDSGGVNSVTLTTNEIPTHSHQYFQPTFGIDIESVGVPDPTGVGNPPVPTQTTSVGGGSAHENRQPYRAVKFAIIAG